MEKKGGKNKRRQALALLIQRLHLKNKGGSRGSTRTPPPFVGKQGGNKGVQRGAKREQKEDQSLPAEYPGQINVQGTD